MSEIIRNLGDNTLLETSKPNAILFNKIADIIEENPHLHEQETWFENFGHSAELPFSNTVVHRGIEYKCDTNQCIAGWAIVLDNADKELCFANQQVYVDGDEILSFVETAAKILGLSFKDADTLFYTTNMDLDWPSILREIADGHSVSDVLDSHFEYCD